MAVDEKAEKPEKVENNNNQPEQAENSVVKDAGVFDKSNSLSHDSRQETSKLVEENKLPSLELIGSDTSKPGAAAAKPGADSTKGGADAAKPEGGIDRGIENKGEGADKAKAPADAARDQVIAGKVIEGLSNKVKQAAGENGGNLSPDFVNGLKEQFKDKGVDVKGGAGGVILNQPGDANGIRINKNGEVSTVDAKTGETKQNPAPTDVVSNWDAFKQAFGGQKPEPGKDAPRPAEPARDAAAAKPEQRLEAKPEARKDNPQDLSPQAVANRIKDSVVQIETRMGGTSIGFTQEPARQTAFKIDQGPEAKPGERLLGTVLHGAGDHSFYKFVGQNGNQFKNADKDRDGQLSKEEIAKKVEDTAKDRPSDLAEVKFQADYLLKNYDQISALSKQLDPKATGITEAGLKEHYRKNVDVTVKDGSGTFKAELHGGDQSTDAAVLKIKGMTPEQDAAFGKGLRLGSEAPAGGEKVVTAGFRHGDFKVASAIQNPGADGFGEEAQRSDSKVLKARIASDSPMQVGDERKGMSGGPQVRLNGEVVGLNHGGGLGGGPTMRSIPVESLNKLITQLKKSGKI